MAVLRTNPAASEARQNPAELAEPLAASHPPPVLAVFRRKTVSLHASNNKLKLPDTPELCALTHTRLAPIRNNLLGFFIIGTLRWRNYRRQAGRLAAPLARRKSPALTTPRGTDETHRDPGIHVSYR